ncbi:MAG: beta/gamma crystallin-related protein [Acidobacteriota bacterium]
MPEVEKKPRRKGAGGVLLAIVLGAGGALAAWFLLQKQAAAAPPGNTLLSLTAGCPADPCKAGDKISGSGRLTQVETRGGIAGADINIFLEPPGGSLGFQESVITDATGNYVISPIQIREAGTFRIQARYAGDTAQGLDPAESRILTLEAGAQLIVDLKDNLRDYFDTEYKVVQQRWELDGVKPSRGPFEVSPGVVRLVADGIAFGPHTVRYIQRGFGIHKQFAREQFACDKTYPVVFTTDKQIVKDTIGRCSITPIPPGPPASVFQDVGFRGRQVNVGGDVPDLRSINFNDEISSVSVPGGAEVILYKDINFGGVALGLKTDISDLRTKRGPGPDGTWNDQASSIKFIPPLPLVLSRLLKEKEEREARK